MYYPYMSTNHLKLSRVENILLWNVGKTRKNYNETFESKVRIGCQCLQQCLSQWLKERREIVTDVVILQGLKSFGVLSFIEILFESHLLHTIFVFLCWDNLNLANRFVWKFTFWNSIHWTNNHINPRNFVRFK